MSPDDELPGLGTDAELDAALEAVLMVVDAPVPASQLAEVLEEPLARVTTAAAGDLLLCRSGPGQLHLAVGVDGGIVHADAGLRRVVERPGAVPWPVLGVWRWEG